MLKLVYPAPRTSWCQMPLLVTKVTEGDPYQLIEYTVPLRSRSDVKAKLARTDVIWHDVSSVLALVIESPTRRTSRILPLIAPESEDEVDGFNRSGGKGTWLCVAQAWTQDWDVPKELYEGLPEVVDTSNPQTLDLLPGQRESNRRAWQYEGKQDPWGESRFFSKQSFNPKQLEFFNKQTDALRRLFDATGDEGETDILPKAEDIPPGEFRDSVVPLDPNEKPAASGKLISYKKGKK